MSEPRGDLTQRTEACGHSKHGSVRGPSRIGWHPVLYAWERCPEPVPTEAQHREALRQALSKVLTAGTVVLNDPQRHALERTLAEAEVALLDDDAEAHAPLTAGLSAHLIAQHGYPSDYVAARNSTWLNGLHHQGHSAPRVAAHSHEPEAAPETPPAPGATDLAEVVSDALWDALSAQGASISIHYSDGSHDSGDTPAVADAIAEAVRAHLRRALGMEER